MILLHNNTSQPLDDVILFTIPPNCVFRRTTYWVGRRCYLACLTGDIVTAENNLLTVGDINKQWIYIHEMTQTTIGTFYNVATQKYINYNEEGSTITTPINVNLSNFDINKLFLLRANSADSFSISPFTSPVAETFVTQQNDNEFLFNDFNEINSVFQLIQF